MRVRWLQYISEILLVKSAGDRLYSQVEKELLLWDLLTETALFTKFRNW